MKNFVIRPAVIGDQKDLQDLQRRASLTNEGDRDALLAHPDAIEVPQEQIAAGSVFVLRQDEAMAGFAALLPRNDQNADLDAMFVEPTLRRRGVGRALVEHCSELARSRGSTFLHVVGNPHAKEFYMACGFEVTGTASTRFGPGILMRKPL